MHPKLIIPTARQSQAQGSHTASLLDEIARQGARRMLLEALRLEADEYGKFQERCRIYFQAA